VSTPGYGLFTPSRSGALASPVKPLVRDEEDVFGRVESIPVSSSSAPRSSSGGKKDSVADRRQALYDRVSHELADHHRLVADDTVLLITVDQGEDGQGSVNGIFQFERRLVARQTW
jgi:hypothetical protein